MSDLGFTEPEPQPSYELEPITPAFGSDTPEHDSPAKAIRATITKSAARKIIDKYIDISRAPKRQTQVLASALGTKNNAADIAATIASATRNPLTALAELETIAAATTPFEAMIAALALGRDGSKRVWALLGELGKAVGTLPTKDATAAARIAETVASLTDSDRSDLEVVRAFGRK